MGKKMLYKIIIPVICVWVLYILFRPLCVMNGEMNYWKLLFLTGVPFGIHKVFFVLFPKSYGIGETVGMFAVSIMVGGVIGSVIVVGKLLAAVYTIITAIGAAGKHLIERNTEVS